MRNRFYIIRKFCARIVLIMVMLVISMASSAELYKYTNEDGITVLDNYVPARYVKDGYTILSLDGRILEVIPRALTEEELRDREDTLAESQRLAREEREKIVADQNLLVLYSTPEDVERARDTKLRSIEGFIDTQKGNLRRLEGQKRKLEASLADIERVGGTINQDSLDRINTIEGRMVQINSEISVKRDEMEILRASYAIDLKRVRELYGSHSVP